MSTIIKEEENVNSNLSTAASPKNHNTGGLAVKLNLFKKESATYNSHRFFVRVSTGRLIPKGIETKPEPTIGNFDQDFVDDWYTNLKQISIVLEKQIAAYCDKTEEKTHNETKIVLKEKLKKRELRRCKKHCNIQ